jgi:chromosome segregation ATPase
MDSPPVLRKSMSCNNIHMTKTMKCNLTTLRNERKNYIDKIKNLEAKNKKMSKNLTECTKTLDVISEYMINLQKQK